MIWNLRKKYICPDCEISLPEIVSYFPSTTCTAHVPDCRLGSPSPLFRRALPSILIILSGRAGLYPEEHGHDTKAELMAAAFCQQKKKKKKKNWDLSKPFKDLPEDAKQALLLW